MLRLWSEFSGSLGEPKNIQIYIPKIVTNSLPDRCDAKPFPTRGDKRPFWCLDEEMSVYLDLLREWNYRAYHTLQNSTKCIAALSHFSQHISEFRTLIPFWIHTSAISHVCWHFGNNFWSISEISWLGELQWEDTAPVLWDGDQGNWNLRLIENMFSNCKFSDFWNM